MAKTTIEIEVRVIENGAVKETACIIQEDGSPLEKAFILGEGEGYSTLAMINCDRVDACCMIKNNDKAAQIAKVAALSMMILDKKSDKHEEAGDNGGLGESQEAEPEDG